MRPQPSPPLANPVAQSLQLLNRDAERLLSFFRGRSAIRTAVWDGDALPDGASLSIALAEGSSLSVVLTCARRYERGGVEGGVAFSASPGLSLELANSAERAVTRTVVVGSIGMWVVRALESLWQAGRVGRDERWTGCLHVAQAYRREAAGCEMLRRGVEKRTGGELSAWERARVAQAVIECRRFGYEADWESWDDGECGVLVEVCASMAVAELGMSVEAVEASRFLTSARVEVRALFLDGFRAVSEWNGGERQVRFRVMVLANADDEQALKDGAGSLLAKGFERVLNEDFFRMARLTAEGAADNWREALLRARELDEESRAWDSRDDFRSGDVAVFEMDDGEADEMAAERGNLALLALRWVRRGLLGCMANCVACCEPLGLSEGSAAERSRLRACEKVRCRVTAAGEESAGVSLQAFSPVEAEILRDPLVTDLLISLVYSTVASRTDLLPPQETLQIEEEFAFHYPFTKGLDPGPPAMAAVAPINPPTRLTPLMVKLEERKDRILARSRKPSLSHDSYMLLREVIDSIPGVDCLLVVAASGKSLKEYLLKSAHPLAYEVLEWILSSSGDVRLHSLHQDGDRVRCEDPIVPMQNEEYSAGIDGAGGRARGKFGLDDAWQFFVEPVSSSQEADFLAKKRAGGGSAYVFHGSPLDRWWSILHHSLDFDEIIHGRSCGSGVYVSPSLTYANHYARKRQGTVVKWQNSLIKPDTCTGIIEIVDSPVDKSFVYNSRNALVINETRDIAVRFLILKESNGHSYRDALDHIHAAGRSLSQTLHVRADHEDFKMSGSAAGLENDPLSDVFDLSARPRHRMLARQVRGFEEPADDLTDKNRVILFARYRQIHGETGSSFDVGGTLAGTWRTMERIHIPIVNEKWIHASMSSAEGPCLLRRTRAGLLRCSSTSWSSEGPDFTPFIRRLHSHRNMADNARL